MLYCCVNSSFVDANDADKVVKVIILSNVMLFLYYTLNVMLKYINSTLKCDFGLDTTSKPKPVAGLDDLLLLLV